MSGEPANAYVFTLAPDGPDAITFSLVADQACASGGICAADGTMLTAVPAPLVIGPPITVGFGAATYPAIEGDFVFVSVRLSAAHVRFSADRGEVSEGGEVRLTFDIANDVTFQQTETINLAIAGTATPDVDFTLVDEGGQALSAPYAIAFPPGVFSVTATVHVTDDADPEPDEDISIGASLARSGEPLGTSEIVVAANDATG